MGEKNITQSSIQKLSAFNDNMESMISTINQEASSKLFMMLKPYILYSLAAGSIISGSPMNDTRTFILKYMSGAATSNGKRENYVAEPLPYFISTLVERNGRAASAIPRILGDTSYYRFGDEVKYRRLNKPPVFSESVYKSDKDAEEDSVSTQIVKETSAELAHAFYIMAKRNPKQAAKFLDEVYDIAPDEYIEAFWASMRTGVRKTLMRKIRKYVFSLGKTLLSRF